MLQLYVQNILQTIVGSTMNIARRVIWLYKGDKNNIYYYLLQLLHLIDSNIGAWINNLCDLQFSMRSNNHNYLWPISRLRTLGWVCTRQNPRNLESKTPFIEPDFRTQDWTGAWSMVSQRQRIFVMFFLLFPFNEDR